MGIEAPVDVKLCGASFDAHATIAGFQQRHFGSGAIASFTGIVRAGNGVEELELHDYPPLTGASMLDFARLAWTRFELDGLLAWHRKGLLTLGEPIVLVAAAAQHRRAAFDATDFLIDHLKCKAWFWKRERRRDGWHWVEPRPDDHAALARWR